MAGRHDYDLNEEHRIYLDGIRLFNEGQFFEAHDTWEECWRGVHDRRREQFYRALIQSAVTLELLRRGRAGGVPGAPRRPALWRLARGAYPGGGPRGGAAAPRAGGGGAAGVRLVH